MVCADLVEMRVYEFDTLLDSVGVIFLTRPFNVLILVVFWGRVIL